MSKTIKVSEQTYSRLEDEFRGRETFNDIIERLLEGCQLARRRRKRAVPRVYPRCNEDIKEGD